MKCARLFLLFFFLALIPCTAQVLQLSKEEQRTATMLLKTLRSQMPSGWHASMSYDNGCMIEVVREKPTMIQTILANSDPTTPEPSEMKQYRSWFMVVPYVSQNDYSRMKSENEIIQKKLAEVRSQIPFVRTPLGNAHISSNSQDTEETKRAIVEYNRLVDTFHRLPDYYYKDISIQMGENFTSVVDEKVRAEWIAVEEKLLNNFSKYQ